MIFSLLIKNSNAKTQGRKLSSVYINSVIKSSRLEIHESWVTRGQGNSQMSEIWLNFSASNRNDIFHLKNNIHCFIIIFLTVSATSLISLLQRQRVYFLRFSKRYTINLTYKYITVYWYVKLDWIFKLLKLQ